jgi:hypothetical protein
VTRITDTPSPAAPPASDPTAARDLAAALRPGEDILWAGRPDERHYARTDSRLIALGIFWVMVAGAGFWGFTATLLSDEYSGVAYGARIAMLLVFAAPFIAVALFCLGGHVVMKRRGRLRRAYAITTQRVLAVRPALRIAGPPQLRELALDKIRDVRVEAVRRESGTVEFHAADASMDAIRFDTVRGAEGVAELARVQRTPST